MPAELDSPNLMTGPFTGSDCRCDVRELVEIWRHVEYRVHCRRPRDLEDLPDLAVRIRGAFGRALAEKPPPVNTRRDPFQRPPPFAVFFGDTLNDPSLPRPFVIGAEVHGRNVIVTLVVFAGAMFWAHQARDALIAALAGGVSLTSGGRMRVVFEPFEVETAMVDGLDVPSSGREAILVLTSPLVIRRGRALVLTMHSLLSALATRVEGLAKWQGFEIAHNREEIRTKADGVTLIGSELGPIGFMRHSQRQRDRDIPVAGFKGKVVLRGDLEPLLPYLAICEVGHLGSHAGLGLGRYRLVVYT